MDTSTPKAVQSCHEFLLWLIPRMDKFPRIRRFTLGERLESSLLSVLENLVAAAYAQRKKETLSQANNRLQVARHLWRLCYELKVIPLNRYEYGARCMHDLGQQIGGWIRSRAEDTR